MENTNNRGIWLVIFIIFILGAIYLYGFTGDVVSSIPFDKRNQEKQRVSSDGSSRMIINFEKEGRIKALNSEDLIETSIFIYEEGGGEASLKLTLNPESECIFSGESILCQAISSPLSLSLNDRIVRVVGFKEEGTLNVAQIQTVEMGGATTTLTN